MLKSMISKYDKIMPITYAEINEQINKIKSRMERRCEAYTVSGVYQNYEKYERDQKTDQNLIDELTKRLPKDSAIVVGLYDSSKMGMFVPLITTQAWIWNTTLDEIYRAAIQNIRDQRSVKSDGNELIRRLLPQYLY